MILNIVFWLLLLLLFYTYIGYGLVLWCLVKLKFLFRARPALPDPDYEPEVCLFVTAYNEKDYVQQKVVNSFALDYPREKVHYLWVTDGSDDGTPEMLKQYDRLKVLHQPERRGKMHAMNRGMQTVTAPIVIFSDSNTILGPQTIREMVRRFADAKVGCVAGEKRIIENSEESAAGAGEGLYWRFESWIKKLDADLNSAVGAAGELFAVRTELFEPVEPDTLLDDFIISLRIARKGYKIAYAPEAYAQETASFNVKEELKRKIRIAAGGVQTLFRLRDLLNIFRYKLLSWQYISHKVLRWTIAPVSLFVLFFVNLVIVVKSGNWLSADGYTLFFYWQIFCYYVAFMGWYFENRKLRFKGFFAPYYFVMINYAALAGIVRFFKGRQSVNWEKSKRA